MSKLEKAQHALRVSEERLSQAVRVSLIGIFEHDHLTNTVYLSPEMRAFFGLSVQEELVPAEQVDPPRPLAAAMVDFIHPDDRPRMLEALARAHDPAGDGLYDVEHRHVRRDGTIRWMTTRAQTFFEGEGAARRAVRTVGAARDITEAKETELERVKLQSQLSQAQKMDSVGRLAGGVAHDFNNMLNVILGWTDLALSDVDATHPLHGPLTEIHAAAERSARLTRQLLAFARRQPVAPKVLNLNDEVGRTLTMLGRMIGEDILLEWRPGHDLWPVCIDPSQVDQVLANLAANARDAINGVGRVMIATDNVVADDAWRRAYPWLKPGPYVQLKVIDDGSGMDQETLGHIFEPFYTTKVVGQGTGLGLATVYGIVKQNEGAIHLSSEVGRGTTVSILLPRYAGASAEAPAEGRREPSRGGHETILLVEDEEMVLDLARTMLQRLGYTVLAASTPAEAIRLAEANRDAIDLLVTDVVMPAMSGPDLAAQLVAGAPHLKCLFASGYFTGGLRPPVGDGAHAHFLHKPFEIHDLAAKVREALDG
jgi:signal transduction histidine kinase